MGIERIESERFELTGPFGRGIAKALDADTAGQAPFDCSFDQSRRKEDERDGQVDLPDAASLVFGDLIGIGN